MQAILDPDGSHVTIVFAGEDENPEKQVKHRVKLTPTENSMLSEKKEEEEGSLAADFDMRRKS